MPQATFSFPADLKWGVASSAHQNEGGNTGNDWWAWEQQDGRVKEGHKSGRACDWWNNAEADFDRAADLGINSLRLSIEWSRVEPSPGEFDDAALGRYFEMLAELRARGIEPMVALHHFANPLWLAEQGGWETSDVVPLFARFARRVVQALRKQCDLWCTIVEPSVYSFLGYLDGVFPPGRSEMRTTGAVLRNMLSGHAAAYRAIHDVQPGARVGLAHSISLFDPADPGSALDRRVARWADKVYNESVLSALERGWWPLPWGIGPAWRLRGTLDWIGLNYYTRYRLAFDRSRARFLFCRREEPTDAELLDGGYGEFYPEGIFRCLRRLDRLKLPIYITENGIPDDDDDQRPRYLLAHLHQVWHAIQMGSQVKGYYHWTLVDNFEWAHGWTLRFGLISLNPKTQTRKSRRSAQLYSRIVENSAITPELIDEYAPELRSELLPG